MHGIVAIVLFALSAWPAARATADEATVPSLLLPPVELVDLAPPDQRYDQREDAARAELLGARLRQALAASHRYRLLDGGAAARPPYRYLDCKACMADWARRQGADLVLVAWVQKESRLILSVNLALIDVAHPQRPASGGSVDLRGDTDATWLAGGSQLLERTMGVSLPP